MEQLDLIVTLAGGLTAALVLGYVTQRIGLSPIVGYLIAGIVVGPATPGFEANREVALQLADVGVILLMFGVGLQFHFRELLAVRRIAVPGALAQIVIVTALGTAVLVWAGGTWKAGVVYGFAISLASSVVLIRVLSDNNHLHTPTGHIAVGWEVLKDLFTVVALVLIPLFFGRMGGSGNGEDSGGDAALAILFAILKVAGLIIFLIFAGGRLIPWILGRVAASRSRELFTLTILVIALGIAVGSAKLFGVSMALGALLAGMVVGRSDFSFRAASEALPMRDAFAVLFFVSVGMLFEPSSILESPGLLVLTLALVMIAKPVIAFVVAMLLGYPSRIGLGVAAALGQIGEFSFIIATLGVSLGIFSGDATNGLIGAAVVSISLNSIIYKTVAPINRWISHRPSLFRLLNFKAPVTVLAATPAVEDAQLDPQHRAVVVGYGPVGRTLTQLLQEQGIEPSIIEMNLKTVQELRQAGMQVFFGDATLRTILEQAGVPTAGTLILTVSGFKNAKEVIKIARQLNPKIHVIVRAAYLADIPDLRAAEADQVFSGEGEVALGMTEYILSRLGATPDQIDRERARVHNELY